MRYFVHQNSDSFTNPAIIVPIGSLNKALIKNLSKVLNERFKIKFFIKKPLEIPKDAFGLNPSNWTHLVKNKTCYIIK